MTTGPPASGSRLSWRQVPERVRRGVEELVGARVAAARDRPGGFSPGAAARLRLADGRRVFVKAAGHEPNPETPALHRREAAVSAALPPLTAVPRLRHTYDDGDWIALILEDVGGRQPALPWQPRVLERVLAALARLHEALTPCPWAGAPDLAVSHAAAFAGWRRLAGRPPAGLDSWSWANLDRLAALEEGWAAATAGGTLLHVDVRADNILLSGGQRVVFVDWPHASRGAAWFDVVAFAPSVAMQGGPPPEWLFARHPAGCAADPAAVTAGVAALAGLLTERSLAPPPAGLPTLRAFQAAQAAVTRDWLVRRTGWRDRPGGPVSGRGTG